MRLLVVESNDIIRAGLAALLEQADHEIIQAFSWDGFLAAVEHHELDAVILSEDTIPRTELDVRMHLEHRREFLRLILRVSPTEHLLLKDADGVILQDATADQLLACIDSVCAGHRWADPHLLDWFIQGPTARSANGHLTPREHGVAALIGRGLRNKEIAREMKLSEATVKMHLHHIYEKLRLSGRTELALRARELSGATDRSPE